MYQVIFVVHVMAALGLIALVLLQQGKGADMGAAFGSGASSTVFGASGSGSFMTRGTAVLATTFFLTSLTLAYFSGQGVSRKSVTEIIPISATIAPQDEMVSPSDMPAIPVPVPAASETEAK
jgi:preprotein translocase subunit SecG